MIDVMESKIAALEDEVATIKSEREEVVNTMESTTQKLSLARDEVSTHSAIVSELVRMRVTMHLSSWVMFCHLIATKKLCQS